MSIVINKTNPIINIDRNPGRLDMQSRTAKLELTQKQPIMGIQTQAPVLEISQYQAFASAGRKNNADFIRDVANSGEQAVAEYVAKKCSDGDALSRVPISGNVIAQLAESDSMQSTERGYSTIPAAGPTFNLRRGTVNYNPPEGNPVKGTYTEGQINLNFTPTQIKISLKQYASINLIINQVK